MIDLLKSPRFWGIVAIGLLQGLVLFNIITNVQSEGLIQILQAIIAGAVVVRTVDRNGDKKVEGSKIEAGIPPAEAKIATP